MSAVERVTEAFARLEETDRPEVWISLRSREQVLAEAAALDARAPGPLTGVVLAVKDNIDVAGLTTTAGCPAFAYEPAADAPAVARLRAAGAIVLGKTNLDQFATGLVGTRSPHGPVRDALRPEYISGGSSSGSAVAVALGIVDGALGTDTAGSGRVPAAFQGLVGIKPTYGLIPTAGVVPACRTLDCVSVFTADAELGQELLWTMAAPAPVSPGDQRSIPPGEQAPPSPVGRVWPADAPLALGPQPRVAVPTPEHLEALTADGRRAFSAAVARMTVRGATIVEIDLAPFLEAGRLLYGGAFVAERHAAVGAFVDTHREAVDPVVGTIIADAGQVRATHLVSDGERLEELARVTRATFGTADALLLPTTLRQPTIAEVAADPVDANARLGLYTTFANLLDMCAIALPAGEADGGRFGVSLLAPAFGDRVLADLASMFLSLTGQPYPTDAPGGTQLLVVGAHRRGQPLNHQLTGVGGRFTQVALTSADYRLHALDTDPPKPGLVRVADGGVAIEGELWALPPAALGPFLAALPRPMTLGQVTLDDGRSVVGFACEPGALEDAPDISQFGSWPAYLASRARSPATTAAGEAGPRHRDDR
jgi:allophanate hydrolase